MISVISAGEIDKKIDRSLSNTLEEPTPSPRAPPPVGQDAPGSAEYPRVGLPGVGGDVADAPPDREERLGNHVRGGFLVGSPAHHEGPDPVVGPVVELTEALLVASAQPSLTITGRAGYFRISQPV